VSGNSILSSKILIIPTNTTILYFIENPTRRLSYTAVKSGFQDPDSGIKLHSFFQLDNFIETCLCGNAALGQQYRCLTKATVLILHGLVFSGISNRVERNSKSFIGKRIRFSATA